MAVALNKSFGEKEALFQQTYLKALLDNKNNLNQWNAYKDKYKEVVKSLNYYEEKHQHSVCIPIGKKAFVKGKLVHTNDVWVTLGCGWFLKTSSKKAVDICERRIKHADELIEKWEKESKLLESMREYSVSKDIFGGEGSKEIVEPFDENQEKNWKEEHREKERKYRKQLKELKEKTGSPTLNDEKDIWEHLEALELQEEIEDELNRIGHNDTSSEDDSEGDSENDSEDDSENDSDDISSNEDDALKNDIEKEVEEKCQSLQSKIIEISSTDFKDDCNDSDMISNSKTVMSSNKRPKKRVTFENTDKTENKASSENVQDAVLDVVKENFVAVVNSKNESKLKRPMSKFKMSRNISK